MDYLSWRITDFEKNNLNRKINKILVPKRAYFELKKLYLNYDAPPARPNSKLTYNGIPIEWRKGLGAVVLIPEGELTEALYGNK